MDKVNLWNKRILVTGGNGFLGKQLIKQLIILKAKVFCLDIQNHCLTEGIEYAQIDLRNKRELNEFTDNIQPEIIYHLAASLDRTRDFEFTDEIFDTNAIGTINLLNALVDISFETLIYTSTSEVYGGNQITPPFKEDCDFVPASPYSLSKYAAEMAIRTYSELYNKNFSILRLFNFYGKEMPHNYFLPQLVERLYKNKDFDMTNGEQLRDYLNIDDVISTLLLASKSVAYKQVFNVCSGKAKTLKEIALGLKKMLNSESQINFGALPYRKNEVWEMVGDNAKMKELFDFNPQFELSNLLKSLTKNAN
jgi:nucleoside-diphosphate-sugar epimerase